MKPRLYPNVIHYYNNHGHFRALVAEVRALMMKYDAEPRDLYEAARMADALLALGREPNGPPPDPSHDARRRDG